jgi:hypothetical protein
MRKGVKWITEDIFKEECDTLLSNNLSQKDVKTAICEKAKKWFMTQTFIANKP